MSIKIISGILVPPKGTARKSGIATIDFNPHTVSGEASGFHMNQIGPDGSFSKKPCYTVSLRSIGQIDKDQDQKRRAVRDQWEEIDLTTSFDDTKRNSMEVKWSASGDSWINEISYMIIGEVD